MIKKIITEEVECVDIEYKIQNSNYEKRITFFGITIYTHQYKLTMTKPEDEEEKKIGFKSSSS